MDRPKMLGDSAELQVRLKQVNDTHVVKLTEFVHRLRREKGADACIPYFDPWDGGEDAEVMFLLEAPGPKAKNSGFVSRNNPDETAKNIFEISQTLGIDRKRTVIWNTVPWYIGSEQKIRPAKAEDIAVGIESLEELIRLLPKLRAIVLVGRKAQKAEKHVKDISSDLKIFKSPHPSPMFVNRKPENKGILVECWRDVKTLLDA